MVPRFCWFKRFTSSVSSTPALDDSALSDPVKPVIKLESDAPRNTRLPVPKMYSLPKRFLERADRGAKLVSIHASVASSSSLSLAILDSASRPLRAPEVSRLVNVWLPETPPESVYNILRNCERGGLLKCDSEGWTSVRGSNSISLCKDFVWGPPGELNQADIAAHRREGILRIIERYPGLRALQITRCLLDWRWIKAPITKTIVGFDLAILTRQGFTQRRLGGRAWFLADRTELASSWSRWGLGNLSSDLPPSSSQPHAGSKGP